MKEKVAIPMKKLVCKGMLVPAAALYLFGLGLETGGFQYSLLKISETLSLDSAAMGLLPAAQYTALTLAPLIMGRFSDRMDKKRLYLLGILCSTLGCLLATRASSAFFLGLCVFLMGWGQGLGGFVNAALLSQVYPRRSGAYMNLTQSFFSLGAVISPLITAYSAAHWGTAWQLPFLLGGLALFLALAFLFLADCAPSPEAAPGPSREGGAAFSPLRSPALLLLLAAILLYVAAENGATYFFGPLFSLEFNNMDYSAYAVSAFWLAMFLSRMLFGVLNLSPHKLILACFVGMALSFLPPALSPSAGLALAACIGAGFICGPVWPLLLSEASRMYPAHSGAAAAAAMAITGLGAALSPAFMGLLGSLSSYRQVFFALALMSLGGWKICRLRPLWTGK